MGKNVNVILYTTLVFLVVADLSIAGNSRNLVDSPPTQHSNNSSDTPISSLKQSSPVGKEKKNEPPPAGEDSSKDKQVEKDKSVTPPPVNVKESSDNSTSKGAVKEKEKGSEGKGAEKEKGKEKAEDKVDQKVKEKGEEKEEQKEVQKEKEEEKEKEEQKEEQKEKEEEKGKEKEEQKEEQKEKEEEKGEEKENRESKTDVPNGGSESCDAMESRCQDQKVMTACIKSVDHDSKALVLLIQNKGHSSLKVNITASFSGNKKMVIIPKLRSQQVDMPLSNARINEITLTAGNGYCVLHLGAPILQGNYFQWMPSYAKFMTPIYGAYFILAITFIAGGVWACCWLTKRKGHREVPYQELEMSRPETAVAVETAEGWDEVWDDDWDEEKAVRSPGGHGISANGLTSRTPKKDDWEDWDD